MPDNLYAELTNLLNKHSQESGSDTPDWVLAQYLLGCLAAFNEAVVEREKWYGRRIKNPETNRRFDPRAVL